MKMSCPRSELHRQPPQTPKLSATSIARWRWRPKTKYCQPISLAMVSEDLWHHPSTASICHRRQGVYRAMYQHLKMLSESEPDVYGFRLYVEKNNKIAQHTYEALGMKATDYILYESQKPS